MADNEIIGRTSCPVCGCAGQDVKINKNNKLYMFCDNGCAVKWNSAQVFTAASIRGCGDDRNRINHQIND